MTQAKTALEDTKEDLDRAVQKTRDAAEIVRKLEASAPSAVEEPSADAPRRIVSLSETETQQEKIDLGDGYVAQKRAATRLAMLAQVFEFGCMQKSSAAIYFQLARTLFRSQEDIDKSPGAEQAVSKLAEALYQDFHIRHQLGESQEVAAAWGELVGIIRALGRDI